jgi:hypothetical protein
VTTLQQLVEAIAGEYRWGLHPLKVFAALVAPLAVAWLADRRLRAGAAAAEQEEERIRQLPRIRRR